jgi:hypothetical protein
MVGSNFFQPLKFLDLIVKEVIDFLHDSKVQMRPLGYSQ